MAEELDELKRKLDAIGPVNPMADEEYRELETRYEFVDPTAPGPSRFDLRVRRRRSVASTRRRASGFAKLSKQSIRSST